MASPNELSFLPEDYLERKARRRANILCGALSVVVMGTIGTAFYLSERSMRGLDAEVAEIDGKHATATAQIEAVNKMYGKQRQIVQHAELAAALVEKVPRSNLLATFTNALPAGASLLELSLESKPRTPPPAPAGQTAFEAKKAAAEAAKKPAVVEAPKFDVFIKLAGVADNEGQVGEFIAKLNKSPLLKDVNLVMTDSYGKDKVTLRRFQLRMMVNPAAQVNKEVATAEAKSVGVAE